MLVCYGATRIQINAFLSRSGSGKKIEMEPDPHPKPGSGDLSGSGSGQMQWIRIRNVDILYLYIALFTQDIARLLKTRDTGHLEANEEFIRQG